MPNHITNILEFDCTPERFREIAESLKSNPEEPLGQVDFNKLIPMPESLAIEAGSRGEKGYRAYKEFLLQSMPLDDAAKDMLEASFRDRFKDDPETWELGKQYFQNIELYGAPNWYDWCCEHWNTKWNAYECLTVDPMDRRLEFLTAWSSVPPIVEAISRKVPDATITYRWADENIGFNVGEVVFRNGEMLEDRTPEEGSKEAYDLAAEIMGEDLEDWGYTLAEDESTYEWHDMYPIPEPANDQHSRSGDASDTLDTLCQKSGLSKASLLRRLILSNPIRERPNVDFLRLTDEINQIGVNFNQLVRKVNATGVASESDLREAKRTNQQVYRLMREWEKTWR